MADIDGCLSKGSRFPFSLKLIERLVETNRNSRIDSNVPPITFCTGRPQPYVECLIQVSQGYMPALCEGGSVLFDPVNHNIFTHPGFGKREEKVLRELQKMVRSEFGPNEVMFEPGKTTHLTLIVAPPLRPDDLLERAREIAARFEGEFSVDTTKVCVHFLFKHLNKGTGIEWLADRTSILPQEMAGIGDATPDLPFLRMMGLSCAPAEAHEEVKSACNVESCKCDADAMLELIDRVIDQNQSLDEDDMVGSAELIG